MTAKEIATILPPSEATALRPQVDSSAHITDIVSVMADSADGLVDVVERGRIIGTIGRKALIDALAGLFPLRDDCSVIVAECDPADYSASLVARAVENVDAHLVGLWPSPRPDGHLELTLRVKALDPEAAAMSLERLGFSVKATYGRRSAAYDVAAERLGALQAFLNV